MSKPPKDELPDIDPTTLAQVTGGGSSGDTNALLGQLTGLLDSIKQIRNVGSQNGINPQEMMLFMMLMQQRNASATTVVAPAPTTWWITPRRG